VIAINKNTIEKFIANYQGGNLASALAAFLSKAASIQQERMRLDQEFGKIQEEFRANKVCWERKVQNFQRGCSHAEVRYIPDPAGGSDSYNQCQFCGKEF